MMSAMNLGTGNKKTLFTEIATPEISQGDTPSDLKLEGVFESGKELPRFEKRKRGRPRKAKVEESSIVFDKISFVPIVTMGSDFLAKRKGELWRMSSTEIDQFSGAIANLATKYGQIFIPYQEEIAFIAICSVYYLSRTMFADKGETKKVD